MKYFIFNWWGKDTSQYDRFLECFGLVTTQDFEEANILLLPGGGDIGINKERDTKELNILNYFLNKNKKIIGICRGLQIFGYYLGNTLEYLEGHTNGRNKESVWHPLRNKNFLVNSRHFWGLRKINLLNHKEILYSEDGIIEFLETEQFLGFQWHPERLWEISLPTRAFTKKKILEFIN